jgi:hypothetical protein
MTPKELYESVVIPAMRLLSECGGPSRSDAADVLLVAISGQEANWEYRRQVGGPARGLWQFEREGGVAGVLTHPATKSIARKVCEVRGVAPDRHEVHPELAKDDLLAACFARLLLFTDPRPLPTEQKKGWDYYRDNWRPGKPHPETWPRCFKAARAVVEEDDVNAN